MFLSSLHFHCNVNPSFKKLHCYTVDAPFLSLSPFPWETLCMSLLYLSQDRDSMSKIFVHQVRTASAFFRRPVKCSRPSSAPDAEQTGGKQIPQQSPSSVTLLTTSLYHRLKFLIHSTFSCYAFTPLCILTIHQDFQTSLHTFFSLVWMGAGATYQCQSY